MTDALAGVRVLDFTQAWAGPTAARLLGDFGADVIKVESETRPDLGRLVGPHVGGKVDINGSGYFVEWNRNKRSIRLDLKDSEDIAMTQRLAATCDAVVENFAPGVMERLGLDYETLQSDNPGLVMLSLSGFGATGSLCRAPAFGQQIEAISGLMSVTGYPDGPPLKPGVSYPDPLSGIAGAAAVVAAFRERRRTGRGRWLDMSMLEVTTAQLSEPLVAAQLTGRAPKTLGNASAACAPHGIYACAGDDRWIAIECRTDEEWSGLVAALDNSPALDDVRFASAAERRANSAAVDDVLSSLVAGHDPEELARLLQRHGAPAARVATTADTFHDEHLRARGFWIPVEHPLVGSVDTAGPMAILSGTPARVRVQPPLLGEHSDEIRGELSAVESRRAVEAAPPAADTGSPYQPLAGIRVVEVASNIAGPYAGKLLAGLGADVIKVEEHVGDPLRTHGPHPANGNGQDAGAASGAAFLSVNAGKRGVCLDLDSDEGRARLAALVAGADMLIEDLTPGQIGELLGGLDQRRPELIVVSITPFGQTGPRSSWRGGDLVCWASGGMAHVTGEDDCEPLRVGADQGAHLAGLQAAAGALIALHHRDATGAGQRVDISIEEAAASIVESAVTDYQLEDHVRGRMGTRHPAAHGVGMQRLSDGRWLFVGTCPQLRMWEAVRELMGDPEWARDPRWESYVERRAHADEVDALAAESFSRMTVDETLQPLLDAGVPVGLVYDSLEVLELPQLDERGFFAELDDPAAGRIRVPKTPFHGFVEDVTLRPAPRLGEHNAELDDELALASARV